MYVLINPTEVMMDSIGVIDDKGVSHTLSIQPHGRPTMPDSWKVSAESLAQFPRLIVHQANSEG